MYHAPVTPAPGETVVVAEGALVACIERLHKIFTAVTPTPSEITALAAVIPALFDVFCVSVKSLSHVTAACEVRADYRNAVPVPAWSLKRVYAFVPVGAALAVFSAVPVRAGLDAGTSTAV